MKLMWPLYYKYTLHCVIWRQCIWYMTSNIHVSTVTSNPANEMLIVVQIEKMQRECHTAINHFWPSPKMCKFPHWFSADWYLCTGKGRNYLRGPKRWNKKYNILCLAIKRSFINLTMDLRYYYKNQNIDDIDQNECKKLLKPPNTAKQRLL